MYLFLRDREKNRQRETERQSTSGGGSERGRYRIWSRLQAPGSKLSAQSPTQGSNSQTARPWPELKSDTQPMNHPDAPLLHISNEPLELSGSMANTLAWQPSQGLILSYPNHIDQNLLFPPLNTSIPQVSDLCSFSYLRVLLGIFYLLFRLPNLSSSLAQISLSQALYLCT